MKNKETRQSQPLDSRNLSFDIPVGLRVRMRRVINQHLRLMQTRATLHPGSVVSVDYDDRKQLLSIFVSRKEGDPPYHAEWMRPHVFLAAPDGGSAPHEKLLAEPLDRVRPVPKGCCPGCESTLPQGRQICADCWICPGCRKIRHSSEGAHDEDADLCDYCWHRQKVTTCPRCAQWTFHVDDDAGLPYCGRCRYSIAQAERDAEQTKRVANQYGATR